MNAEASINKVGWVVLVLAAWDSRAIVPAWMHSPLDKFGWVALMLWVGAAIWFWSQGRSQGEGRAFWIGLSMLFLAGGAVSGLNTLGYIAFALAVAALPGWSWKTLGWFLCSLSWMPPLSWAANALPIPMLLGLRLALAVAGAVILLFPKGTGSASDEHPDLGSPAAT
jgi:hypothetical protein